MDFINVYIKHRLMDLALPCDRFSWVCKEHRSGNWASEIPKNDSLLPQAVHEQCYVIFVGELSVVMMDMAASKAGLDQDALNVFFNATTKGAKIGIGTRSYIPCIRVQMHEGASEREVEVVDKVRHYLKDIIDSTRTALTTEMKAIYEAGLHEKDFASDADAINYAKKVCSSLCQQQA